MEARTGYHMIGKTNPVIDPAKAYTTVYHADIIAPSGRIYEIEKIRSADRLNTDIILNRLAASFSSEPAKIELNRWHGDYFTINDAIHMLYEEEDMLTEKEHPERSDVSEPEVVLE